MGSNDKSTQEIINDLYAIRAGLSYISQSKDKYERGETEVKNAQQELSVYNSNIEVNVNKALVDYIYPVNLKSMQLDGLIAIREAAQNQENTLRKKLNDAKKEQEELEHALKATQNQKTEVRFKWVPIREYSDLTYLSCFLLFLLSTAVVGGLLYWSIWAWKTAWPQEAIAYSVSTLIGLVAVPMFVYYTIEFVVGTIRGRVYYSQIRRKAIKEKKNEIEKIQKRLDLMPEKIRSIEMDIEEAKEDKPRRLEKLEKKIEAKRQEICEAESVLKARRAVVRKEKEKDAVEIEKNLKELELSQSRVYDKILLFSEEFTKQYAPVCHPSNWKDIDSILYYLITGRAETLRDALNLMDRRRDAEMIAKELKAASELISQEVRKTREDLTEALAVCADRICQSVYNAGQAVFTGMTVLAEEVNESNTLMKEANAISRENKRAMEKLVTAQELNNALREKSNATMEQLLRDYEFVNRNNGAHQSI